MKTETEKAEQVSFTQISMPDYPGNTMGWLRDHPDVAREVLEEGGPLWVELGLDKT